MIQGSEEWLAIRCGKATASRVADIVARTKTGYGASRTNYLAELVAERLTGVPAERYQNSAMQWGVDTEAEARTAYEFYADADVQQVGFIAHPTIGETGASPDGLVGDAGMLELKCPNTATHIETLLGQSVPGKYVTQIQWQLACTGREWCDFASYDPRLPESMRLFVKRIERDNAKIAELEGEVIAFLQEVRERVDALRSRYEPRSEPVSVLVAC
jgi:putative phage-type endonuclease